ncbi:MAG: hypothetical protein PHX08_24860 [Lachnospiraceae bacterium]|nr:hypothetical protein [Lachnospiraceae bacterium]
MEQNDFTDKKDCVIYVPASMYRVADRIEQYAFSHEMNVLETIMEDTKSIERLRTYIESGNIRFVLIRQFTDISGNEAVVQDIMQLANIHGVRILTEDTQFAFAEKCENQKNGKYHTVTYPSETVVLNEKNQIPPGFPKGFPTEREAVEYIREQEGKVT